MPNISINKNNQATNFDQFMEYNVRNIFFKNHAKNKAGKFLPDLILFYQKALYEVKASGQHLSFNGYC